MNDRPAPASIASALPWQALSAPCDPARLGFASTEDVAVADIPIVGQDRAVEAVAFAIGMPHGGFNLFALGEEGTGRATLVRRALTREAERRPTPPDWCYVNNFADHRRPKALRLPAGRGRALVEDMKRLIEELTVAIPAVFESDDYRHRKNAIQERFKESHEKAFTALQEKARKREIALIRTPMGLALAPIKDDEVLDAKEFEALPEKEQDKRRAAMEELQTDLEKILRGIPRAERNQREKVRELNREVTELTVGHLIDDLKLRWQDQPGVILHLDAVRADVIENAHEFLPQEGGPPTAMEALMAPQARRAQQTAGPAFRRYQVNLLVDHARGNGAAGVPVIEEDHPTQPNLIGRVEHLAQFGALLTDFNLIKGDALHRANGGYLVLSARKVLMQPFAWESLKRTLRTGKIRIESLGEKLGWVSTVTLEPEPIPLDLKVVLIGEPILYYLLHHYDPEFRELFKVAADFDDRLARDRDGEAHYARLVAAVVKSEKLASFDAAFWVALLPARAAEIPLAERRSGYDLMSAATRAIQDDEISNPGMLWVVEGESLWSAKPANGRACVDCHGDAATSMKGVAARHPAFDVARGRAVNLAGRIEICRTERQGLTPLSPDARESLALAAYVARQSRGLPIAIDEETLAAEIEAGRKLFTGRQGHLNLSCAHCHDAYWGRKLAGLPLTQGQPTGFPLYRLEWQGMGSLQRRLRACLFGIRAEYYPPDGPEYLALETYLMWRARGMALESPAVRP
jgi:sulfur oxidation c-type cytochrome SoxA